MHASLLSLLLQVASVAPTGALDAERLVRQTQRDVEAGREAAMRSALESALVRAPGDRRSSLAIATLDRLTYRYERSEARYRSLVGTVRDGNGAVDPYGAHALLGLGLLRLQDFRLPAADSALRDAMRAFARLGDASGGAQAASALGTVLSRTASLDSAAAMHARAAALAPADRWVETLIACNAALVAVRRADTQAARRARSVVGEALAAGNPRAAGACLAAIAQDFERRTLLDSAAATFSELAALQRRTRNLAALAATRQWQGYMLQTRGAYQQAREALLEAIALGERTRARAATAWASLNLASIALTFGDRAAAGAYARRASEAFVRLGDRWGEVNARQYEGDVALENASPAAARTAYEDVLRLAPAVFPTLAVHAHGRLAAVSFLEGDAEGATRELDAARALARTLDMPEWEREEDAYGRLLVELARGNFAGARTSAHALLRTTPPEQLGTRAELHTRLAEAHLGAGDVDAAAVSLGNAAALTDSARRALSARDFRSAVLHARSMDWDRDQGFATVIAGLVARERVAAAFTLAERRRARVLLEQLARRRSLTDRRDDPSGTARYADDVLDIDAARASLPDSTALLAFVTGVGNEPTTIFVVTRDSLRAVVADAIDAHALELERFAGLVAAGDLPRSLARALGAAFLHDALALLPPNVARLVVIPDGPLHLTPFDILADADGRLLVERFAIALAPSAAIAASAFRASPVSPGERVIAFGDPTGVRLRGAGGDSVPPRLPAAALEAERVARFAPVANVLVGADASESRLRALDPRDVSILHFATHADVDEWSFLRSALLLAPDAQNDGALRGDELSALDLGVPLVVLSACRSGAGAVLAGEGLQGLTAPFLEAGAASVVATLWAITDGGAATMAELFYESLATGRTVGDALSEAKRAARARGISPQVWAAFTLTGDPRTRTALRPPTVMSALTQKIPAAPTLASASLAFVALYGVARMTRRRNGERR